MTNKKIDYSLHNKQVLDENPELKSLLIREKYSNNTLKRDVATEEILSELDGFDYFRSDFVKNILDWYQKL